MPCNTAAPADREHRCAEADTLLVSVIIPAFNAAGTILRAIDSVRAQEIAALEIIVVDDGSSDGTAEVVDKNIRPGERIKLQRMPKNSGVSAARNTGIRLARGTFLAFLDADDIWLPGKLQKQIDAMEQDHAITLVSCNSRLLSQAGVPLKEGHMNRPPVEGDDAWKTLLVYNFIPTPTVLARCSLVRELGGFDESLAVGEDLDLWIRLALRGKVVVLRDILTNYYDSAGSLMKRHRDRTLDIVVPMLERHLVAQRARLSIREIRHIRGVQSFQIGCNLFFSGVYLRSIPAFFKAAYYGSRPLKSLSYIPRAIAMALLDRLISEPLEE